MAPIYSMTQDDNVIFHSYRINKQILFLFDHLPTKPQGLDLNWILLRNPWQPRIWQRSQFPERMGHNDLPSI